MVRAHDSRFTIHDSRFTIHDGQMATKLPKKVAVAVALCRRVRASQSLSATVEPGEWSLA